MWHTQFTVSPHLINHEPRRQSPSTGGGARSNASPSDWQSGERNRHWNHLQWRPRRRLVRTDAFWPASERAHKCVCLRRPTGEKEVGLFVSGCFPHLCLPLVTVWNKTGCLANWTKTLAYLYAGIKRQKASGRKQNIITGMCPKWMLHQGCNGASVTLQVNSCADNRSVVWRWVLRESFGSQQRTEPLSGSVTENTFGRSTNEIWKSSHCNYTHAYLHTIQISFYFNTLN